MKNRRFLTVLAVFALAVIGAAACNNGNNGSGGGGNDGGNGTPATQQPFNNITATELVSEIKVGWNLGNTLDATDFGEGYWPANPTLNFMETDWNNPVTTTAMIAAVKGAGFNAIRIPVSWTKATDKNHKIRTDWMKRVVAVVNYAVENDMYIILNTHHDEHVFPNMITNIEASKQAFRKTWEQIADTFKNYDEKLMFEGLNEPRTKGTEEDPYEFEWTGGTAAERAHLNAYYQIFVDVVRASGGNNDKRMLLINTYAASGTPDAMNGLTLPTDTAAHKLIVSYHAYTPWDFAAVVGKPGTWSKNNSWETAAITEYIDRAYTTFIAGTGVPVIIGEFGAIDKGNEAVRAEWAEYYVDYARSKGIKCFWWDAGPAQGDDTMEIYNRKTNTWPFPQIVAGLMRGAGN